MALLGCERLGSCVSALQAAAATERDRGWVFLLLPDRWGWCLWAEDQLKFPRVSFDRKEVALGLN